MRHVLGAGVALVGLALGPACTPATSPFELAGIYSLMTVNGSPLPFLLSEAAGTRVEVVDDALTLYTGGTYAEAGHRRSTTAGVVTYSSHTDAGSFTRRGDQVTLQSLITIARVGTVREGAFTLGDSDFTLIFRR